MRFYCFDFDGTLFRSPDNPSFGAKWWEMAASLEPPCVPDQPSRDWWIEDVLLAAHTAIEDPDAYTMLLTGRTHDTFRDRVLDLLVQQDLEFSYVGLRPKGESKIWKLATMMQHLEANPTIREVVLYDDRAVHLDFFYQELTALDYVVTPRLINEPVPRCVVHDDARTNQHRDARASYDAGSSNRDFNGAREGCCGSYGTNRRSTGRSGGAMEKATSVEVRSRRAAFLRLAQDPMTDEPSESKMVQQAEDEPGANWRDLFLQPIIRMIRNRFDLEKGQVALVGPTKQVPYGSDTLG